MPRAMASPMRGPVAQINPPGVQPSKRSHLRLSTVGSGGLFRRFVKDGSLVVLPKRTHAVDGERGANDGPNDAREGGFVVAAGLIDA